MISRILNDFIQKSGKSLGYISSKTGIDRSLLSKYSNNSRKVPLNAGIKILKACNGSKEQLFNFVEECNAAQSELYKNVVEEEKKLKLEQEISLIIARDEQLRNAFFDIAEAREKGLSVDSLKEEYGLDILQKLNQLMDIEVLKIENKTYYSIADSFHFNQISSLIISEGIVKHGKECLEVNTFIGDCTFDITNLTLEGRQAMRKFKEKQYNEFIDELKKWEIPTRKSKDSKRVGFVSMFTVLKSLLLAIFLAYSFTTSNIQAGVASGGASGGEGSDGSFSMSIHTLDFAAFSNNPSNTRNHDKLKEETDNNSKNRDKNSLFESFITMLAKLIESVSV